MLLIGGTFILTANLAGIVGASDQPSLANDSGVISIGVDEVRDSAWYVAGDKIQLKGEVNGDVFCAGQEVEISGKVEGSVYCAAQKITLAENASINGNVRLAAQDIAIGKNAVVKQGSTLFAQNIKIDSSALFERDLNGAAETLDLDGRVGRDLAFGMANFNLAGSIGRNADVSFDKANISDSASVGGNFSYTSPSEISILEGLVKGEVSWHQQTAEQTSKADKINSKITSLLMSLVFVAVIALLLPSFVSAPTEKYRNKPTVILLYSMFATSAVITLPLIGLVALLSVYGVWLTLSITIAWTVLLLTLLPMFSYFVGRLALGKASDNIVVTSLAGALVTGLLMMVPYLNIFIGASIFFVGGSLTMLWLKDNFPKPDYKLAIEPVKSSDSKPAGKKSSK